MTIAFVLEISVAIQPALYKDTPNVIIDYDDATDNVGGFGGMSRLDSRNH